MNETCQACGQRIPTGEQRIITALIQARQEQGRHIGDVADAIGCSRQTMWRWEGGSTFPTLDRLIAWADALGVSLTAGGIA
jgi:transcriptional regulator with XRE-family HTH domain